MEIWLKGLTASQWVLSGLDETLVVCQDLVKVISVISECTF